MPYKIRRRGIKWALLRPDGTIKSRHTTKGKAQMSAKYSHSGKKRRKR